MKVVRVNVTIPEDVLRQINQYAERHGYGFLAAASKMAMRTEGGLAHSQPDSSRNVIVLFAQAVCGLATTILKRRETMSYFVRRTAYVPPQCASNWQPFAPNFSLWGASEEF
ncbi:MULTISPECIES: hypothetical protein [unclassified Mesorhizobium]|uniref:hypothetical protein n=1 Tax=unclassified Mesorhizobium TaxID=325217 RepID=UPI001673423A|nr:MULTISPECIES: hypothetical protein [unclassified Mesorhizobium]